MPHMSTNLESDGWQAIITQLDGILPREWNVRGKEIGRDSQSEREIDRAYCDCVRY